MRGCPCGRGAARGPRVPGAGGAGSAGRSWGPGAPPARPGAAHSRSAFLDPGSLEAEHTHPTVPAETHCEQDLPTPAPPTAPPRPSPTPAPASPRVFRYSLNGTNGTCLLVSMGLQLNVTYRTVDNKMVTRQFNVNPDNTTFGGNCSATLATLELHDSNLLLLVLQFSMNESSSRVFLQGVQLNLTLPDARGETLHPHPTPHTLQVAGTLTPLPSQTAASRPPTAR